mgnify:CR=1 FL=1
MPTRYNLARAALDEAIAMSHNLRQLEYHLSEMGYTLGSNPKRKYWTIKGKGDERPIRLHRLGDEYTKERITQRLIENRDNIDFESFQPKIYPTEAIPAQNTERQNWKSRRYVWAVPLLLLPARLSAEVQGRTTESRTSSLPFQRRFDEDR